MSYETIARAIDAARTSKDPLVRATGELLREVRNDASVRKGEIEKDRRLEAIRRTTQDRTPEMERDKAIEAHLAAITRERGPLPTDVAPTNVRLHRCPLSQAADTARALLTRLDAGQNGEVWPGQQANSTTYGWVEVVAVEMNGSYRVRQLGWGSYPNDPALHVPAGDVTPLKDARV